MPSETGISLDLHDIRNYKNKGVTSDNAIKQLNKFKCCYCMYIF